MTSSLPRRRLILSPRPKAHNQPVAYKSYDKETGQVFFEKTAPIKSSNDCNWEDLASKLHDDETINQAVKDLLQHKSSAFLKTHGLNCSRGVPKLKGLALKCAARNGAELTLDAVQGLPKHIIRQLWDFMSSWKDYSFRTWKIFSQLLQEDEVADIGLLKFYASIRSPASPLLSDYLKPLITGSFNFITFLTLNTAFPMAGLVSLSKVTNLGVLEIFNSNSPRFDDHYHICDRLIREWYLATLNKKAFAVLRVLRLLMHTDVTGRSLDFLDSFPALALFDLRGCSLEDRDFAKAESLGWISIDDADPLRILEDLCLKKAILENDEGGDSAKANRETSAQLHSGKSELRKIPRENVAQFFARTRMELTSVLSDDKETFIAKTGQNISRDAPRIRSCNKEDSSIANTWGKTRFRTFARIGELRNNADLVKAGISIGDQVFSGREIISSIPVASLTLGSEPQKFEARMIRGSAFIRVRAASSSKENNIPSPRNTKSARKTAHGAIVESDRALSDSSPARLTVMKKRKKRKLDDVLGSFI